MAEGNILKILALNDLLELKFTALEQRPLCNLVYAKSFGFHEVVKGTLLLKKLPLLLWYSQRCLELLNLHFKLFYHNILLLDQHLGIFDFYFKPFSLLLNTVIEVLELLNVSLHPFWFLKQHAL